MIAMTLGSIATATGAEIASLTRTSSGSGLSFSPSVTDRESLENARITRIATDSRDIRVGDLFVAIRGQRLDGHEFLEAACANGVSACVCDRRWVESVGPSAIERVECPRDGKRVPILVVPDTIEMLGRLAAHYRREVMHPGTVVIAITGTNGKTTTKAMLDHLLQPSFKGRAAPKSFNNAIGVPLTLLSADADDRYLIVEIGSSSPGEVDALARITQPNAAVVTSIGEAHLEGLTDFDGVAEEKACLLDHVRSDGLAVVNIDQPPMQRQLAQRMHRFAPEAGDLDPNEPQPRARIVTIGTSPQARMRVAIVEADIRETTFTLEDRICATVPMPGRHHAINAAAALTIARWFGISPERIVSRLRSFVPLEGRTRLIELEGIVLIDDAYNANPASMDAAVETLRSVTDARRVFVMGDMLELGRATASFHARVVESVLAAGIEVLVAVGSNMIAAVRQEMATGCNTHIVPCDDAERAATATASLLRTGDVVWVKGSRGIGLDGVVRHLRDRVAAKAAVA